MNLVTSAVGLPDIFQSARSTIGRAIAGMGRDAAEVASASSAAGLSSPLEALVDSRQQLLYAQTGARMIKTADEVLGTLLDLHA